MADLDADGRPDLVSGSYPGEIYWFRRKPNGTFAAAEALKAGAGKLNVGRAAAVAVTDWEGDGRPDLLVGDFWWGTTDGERATHGGVWVYPRTDTLPVDRPPAADRPARSVSHASALTAAVVRNSVRPNPSVTTHDACCWRFD